AMLAHETRAAVAAAEGREGDCRRHAARGLDALARMQSAFGSLDLQTSSAMRAGGLLTEGLSSALRSDRPDVIFDWSERARLMSQHVVPLRPPRDEDLAADLAELRTIRAAAGDDGWLADPRAHTLERRIRDRQWASTAAGGATGRIAMTDAFDALGAGEALVAYVFDGSRLVALTLSEGSAVVAELSWKDVRDLLTGLRADLDVAARVTSGPMSTLVRDSLRARVERLSTSLVGPVQPLIASARRIVVLAPGVLSGIPWSMLPMFSGRALTVPGSASAWVGSRARGAFRFASAGFVIGPRVPRAAEEVRSARGWWPNAPTLSGGAATVSAVAELASQVDVLHAAGHGRHAVDNPMFSGMELLDGTLFGYDIDLIDAVPDTVVLSACEVGRSSVRWGEEAVGMARVWLHAGTRAVVAAPVVVADDDACELLGAMHEGLAAGVGPSEALAAAFERTGIVAPFQVHGAGF
ncbi:CHAT domain-containing protein, partial [Microbacterium sp. CPCC 204701]|uniref:CHAT domain-containing protein n=1 Tax=Microbacterium sp. CPCC 204701 TaxID=2493084 RepID=UPI000FD8B5D5